MNFSNWFFLTELAHLARRDYEPFPMGDKKIMLIDMKFEYYPDKDLKNNLSRQGAKFYGIMPDGKYFSFDGKDVGVTNKPPTGNMYFQLPDDWWDYAFVTYADGTVKFPTKGSDA